MTIYWIDNALHYTHEAILVRTTRMIRRSAYKQSSLSHRVHIYPHYHHHILHPLLFPSLFICSLPFTRPRLPTRFKTGVASVAGASGSQRCGQFGDWVLQCRAKSVGRRCCRYVMVNETNPLVVSMPCHTAQEYMLLLACVYTVTP